MRLTRHKIRLAVGLLICAGGLALCLSPGGPFPRLADGGAWLLIGGMLCFVPEFRLRLSRDWFALGLGLIFAASGLELVPIFKPLPAENKR